MIEILGLRIDEIPTDAEQFLPPPFLSDWQARYAGRAETPARASLGGLLLLSAAGQIGAVCRTPRGRPYLAERTIDFNVTHTSRHVFCAISTPDERIGEDLRVGLDAEELSIPPKGDPLRLAHRWFTEGEQRLFAVDPTAACFLRIWTRKEAMVKYTGEGLSALAAADSTAIHAHDLAFWECEADGAWVTLCAQRSRMFSGTIRMLTAEELLHAGSADPYITRKEEF